MSELKLTKRLPELDAARLRPALRERVLQQPPRATRGIKIVREQSEPDVRVSE